MSATVTARGLAAAISDVNDRMETLGPELDALDSRMGDGDTGTMLRRFLGTLAEVEIAPDADLGASFLALAQAGARSTGSSLGTLLVGALMTGGRTLKGRTEIPAAELGPLFAAVRDDLMRRGRTELGNKTIVDGLDALAGTFSRPPADPALAARAAVDGALDEFRDRPSASGRARMYAERTRGVDDPGMRALRDIVYAATH